MSYQITQTVADAVIKAIETLPSHYFKGEEELDEKTSTRHTLKWEMAYKAFGYSMNRHCNAPLPNPSLLTQMMLTNINLLIAPYLENGKPTIKMGRFQVSADLNMTGRLGLFCLPTVAVELSFLTADPSTTNSLIKKDDVLEKLSKNIEKLTKKIDSSMKE